MEDIDNQNENRVYFKCIKEGARLRVKVTSQGYNNQANCQFPRDIRKDGGIYSCPASDITLAKGGAGTYFYRVKRTAIKVEDSDENVVTINHNIAKIYEDADENDCCVCFEQEKDIVLSPCGHYCLCSVCSYKLESCPICRVGISVRVKRDQLQM